MRFRCIFRPPGNSGQFRDNPSHVSGDHPKAMVRAAPYSSNTQRAARTKLGRIATNGSRVAPTQLAWIVPAHNRSDGRPMHAFPRQFVLVWALSAAVMILGGAPAQAGYVSVSAMSGTDGVSTLAHRFAFPLAELETFGDMAGAAAASEPRPDAQRQYAPSEPVPLVRKLPLAAYNFGLAGSAGTSSSSSSGSGPSTSPARGVSRPQGPPLELVSLLPPPTGAVHHFSIASFLFRPPRCLGARPPRALTQRGKGHGPFSCYQRCQVICKCGWTVWPQRTM
jgi:hypothetical protein